ncbi:MAG: thioredoxin domain-containing protein [Capsulimonadales bacterium]|nr:thioredoxin domain-containing protein [Capsulimonadales bacterium]
MKGSGETKLLMILGLIVVLGVGAMFLLNRMSPTDATPTPPPTPKPFAWTDETFNQLTKDAPNVLDAPNATVTIVEFADFECASCRRAFSGVLEKLKKEKLARFHFRHLPLVEIHQRAMPAAMAVEAAGKQGKFWEMYDKLFEGEKTELTDAYIEKSAKGIGLDMAKFKADLIDPASKARIEKDIKAAEEFRIVSTPTFIIKDAKGTYTQVVGSDALKAALLKSGIAL